MLIMSSIANLQRLVFSVSIMLGAINLCAQDKIPSPFFEKEGASKFFASNPDLKSEADKYAAYSLKFYAAGDLQNAGAAHFLSEYLSHLDKYGKNFPIKMREYLLADSELLEDFFSILSPKDDKEKVFDILSKLYASDPDAFIKYTRLAMAISIVFDSPVPKNFPHAQVSEKLLPRKFPKPEKAFATWKSLRERGRMLLQPERLAIDELKYMVATLASDEDREWVQKSVSVNLSNMDKLYSSIKYEHSRVKRKAFDWERGDYRLKTIKDKGGICVDQAYYTVEVAKCRGVPAFIFSGAGADGFHAWAAYMQKPGAWNFDVGRYEGARFVTGRTLDPQTWDFASDHSLNSMREGFRSGKKYRNNEIHTLFARHFLESKDFEKAESAAKAAIGQDQRNIESWEILLKAAEGRGAEESEIISMREKAMKSFFKYPDIDSKFRRELIAYYKSKGREDDARKLTSSIILKTKSSRPDIAMSFAISELEEYIKSSNVEKLMQFYKRLLNIFKSDAAICCNNLTVPTLNALLRNKKFDETAEIMKITRQVLKSSKDNTLSATLDNIDDQLEKIKGKEKSKGQK